MDDFGHSTVMEMANSYLEALIEFEQNCNKEWSELAVEDVDPETFDIVAEDCRLFLSQATAITGLVHLDALLAAIDATEMGSLFYATRTGTGLSFDIPKYSAIGSALDELAERFGDSLYFVKGGRVHRDSPWKVPNFGPTME